MRKLYIATIIVPIMLIAFSCSQQQESTEDTMRYPKDNHSFSNPNEAVIKELTLNIILDFDNKIIKGKASYTIENNGSDKIILDTKDLDIQKVTIGMDDTLTTFQLGDEVEHLGRALQIAITPETKQINVYYATRPESEAVQWLNPQQTAGKVHPFLFTQGEAILTRTWIPIQDSPGIKFTYNARVELPKELMAVMSATNPQEKNNMGVYSFKMKQPIPAYLIALAAGNLEFRSLGPRTGVYAEPELAEKAAYEFGDTEKMLEVAENLYGPYQWERYDIIVLPPSFPFGGMENPRLTFATPTIIAGDRSLTSLVAHEMAHSWSGNLVTNATWDDFWLNEGFTVYFESRIMEAMYGKDYAHMLALLGDDDLQSGLAELEPNDTKLKLDLKGRNPDDSMTDIAYEKGAAFLRVLEEAAGRANFDAFLTQYFADHKFQTLSTEGFVAYLNKNLIEPKGLSINVDEWVYQPGVPKNKITFTSDKFELVDKARTDWMNGADATTLVTSDWSTHEWLHFIRGLNNEQITKEHMTQLDSAFHFTTSTNSEIQCAWYTKAIKNGYVGAYPKMTEFLHTVGRRKFLVPLYKALSKTETGLTIAKGIYAGARQNYHSVSTNTIDDLLGVSDSDFIK